MKINYLRVFSENLKEQLRFYSDVMNFYCVQKSQNNFQLKIGYSTLEFQKGKNPNPCHIAFHIAAEKEEEVLKWLLQRTEVLKDQKNSIIDFPAWKAKSIYFYDHDQNVIEFIWRKDLYYKPGAFTANNLMGIAEIGLATPNLAENFRFLNQYFKLEIYFGSPEIFCAIGDENGLLIGAAENHKTWFPTTDKALASDFDLKFEHLGVLRELNYSNRKLDIL